MIKLKMLNAWPEIDKYSNRCTLYRAILTKLLFDFAIGGSLAVVVYKFLMHNLDDVRESMINERSIFQLDVMQFEEAPTTIRRFRNGIIIDLVLWLVSRGFYMLSVVIAAATILMEHPSYLSVHLNLTIPNLVFDFLVGVKADFQDLDIKLFMLAMIGCDFYNILAINYVYKEMTKIKSVSDLVSNPPEADAPNQTLIEYSSTHCSTCIPSCPATAAFQNIKVPAPLSHRTVYSSAHEDAKNEKVTEILFQNTPKTCKKVSRLSLERIPLCKSLSNASKLEMQKSC